MLSAIRGVGVVSCKHFQEFGYSQWCSQYHPGWLYLDSRQLAIANLIGLGLIIWRTLMPEVGNSPNAAVPPTVPANPESSSEAADLLDAISTPKPLTELLQEAQEL